MRGPLAGEDAAVLMAADGALRGWRMRQDPSATQVMGIQEAAADQDSTVQLGQGALRAGRATAATMRLLVADQPEMATPTLGTQAPALQGRTALLGELALLGRWALLLGAAFPLAAGMTWS
ncbi:hypothetical protein PLESTF_001550100 [Pleodorina starrii]|nr:hypothetical protein PLESTM_000744600 [Pleodorina starrii]GLC74738.1 hypothetical protein PLESTF_001550100 [Pleodorina starrii]